MTSQPKRWRKVAAQKAARTICCMDFWKYAIAYGYSQKDIETVIERAIIDAQPSGGVMAKDKATPPREACQCRVTDDDGEVRHSGKLITFKCKSVCDGTPFIATVCWHHRKWYNGWKNARECKKGRGEGDRR